MAARGRRGKAEALPEVSGVSGQNRNKVLTDALTEMATFERNRGDMHRFYAYTKAVNSLKRYPQAITSGAEAQQLPGIGPRIAEKIDEILQTRELRQLEALKADERQAAIGLIARVPGFGPVAAQRLVDVAGIRSIEELRRCAPGLGLTHHQQVGLRYFEELEERVPRGEVEAIGAVVRTEAQLLDPLFRLDAVGSYRRGLPASGDVDLLLTHPNYTALPRGTAEPQLRGQAGRAERTGRVSAPSGRASPGLLAGLVARLREPPPAGAGIVTDVLGLGEVQFTGVCRLPAAVAGGRQLPHRRIDIKLVPIESYPCALLHYTGSGEFNRQLRVVAQNKRLKLSEYALRPISPSGDEGEPLPILSEADIFQALGLAYHAPADRSL